MPSSIWRWASWIRKRSDLSQKSAHARGCRHTRSKFVPTLRFDPTKIGEPQTARCSHESTYCLRVLFPNRLRYVKGQAPAPGLNGGGVSHERRAFGAEAMGCRTKKSAVPGAWR